MASSKPKAKCPSCGVSFRFKPELAGKTVRCAQCQQAFPLPAEAGDAPAPKSSKRASRKFDKGKGAKSRGPKTGRVKSSREPAERRGSGRRSAGRRGRKKSSPLPLLIIGAVVLIGGLGGLILVLAKKSPPPPGPAKEKIAKKAPAKPAASPSAPKAKEPEGQDAFAAIDKDMKQIKALASRGKVGIPLIAAYLDKEGFASLSAAEELAKFGADALPVLKPRLDSPSADTRMAVLNCLGRMGAPAAPVRAKVEELSKNDPDEKVRGLAAKVLEKI